MKRHDRLTAWSFSTYRNYENCPKQVYYAKVERLPVGAPGPPLIRGSMVHEGCERYLKCKTDEMPFEVHRRDPEFEEWMVELRDARALKAEEEWACTKDWERCGWMDPDVWLRAKIDASYRLVDTVMNIIDFKTGYENRNPGKMDYEQRTLYALMAFMRYPKLKTVETEMWYFDRYLEQGNVFEDAFTRRNVASLKKKWERRAKKMLDDRTFEAKPGPLCRWCDFKDECPDYA